jgi:hypothetical protein
VTVAVAMQLLATCRRLEATGHSVVLIVGRTHEGDCPEEGQQHGTEHQQDCVLAAETGQASPAPCAPRAARKHTGQAVVHGKLQGTDGELDCDP